MFRGLCLFCSLISAALWAQNTAATTTVVRASRMFDAPNGRIITPGLVIITGNRIESAGPGTTIPSGARIIDLGDATILPGFIDSHVHMSGVAPGDSAARQLWALTLTLPERAISGVPVAALTLQAGFTTVRDLGGTEFLFPTCLIRGLKVLASRTARRPCGPPCAGMSSTEPT